MKADVFSGYAGAQQEMIAKAEGAGRAIPPLWPLSNSVAVKPFLCQTRQTLLLGGALLERVAGSDVTMPRSWYHAKISEGTITDADLKAGLAQFPDCAADVTALKTAANSAAESATALPTIADLAADV